MFQRGTTSNKREPGSQWITFIQISLWAILLVWGWVFLVFYFRWGFFCLVGFFSSCFVFFLKTWMWSSTPLSSTAILKLLDGNSFDLYSFRHKLCFVKPDILRMSWRIVSQIKLLFVLLYVCRMTRWCFTLTELASLL